MAEHEVLLSRIPLVEDVQSAWALPFPLPGRTNYMFRAVRPEMVRGFAEGHNAGLWTCLCNILNVVVDGDRQDVATMPLSLGGLGLRDAVRTSPPAFWASWADCIAMVRARHPDVAALILRAMRDSTCPPTLVSVQWHISLSVWKGSSSLHGKPWRMANALRDENQKNLNLEGVATVGSTKRLRGWSVNTEDG